MEFFHFKIVVSTSPSQSPLIITLSPGFKNLLFSDKELRRRVDKYLRIIGRQLRAGEIVKDTNTDIARAIESMHVVAETYCQLTGMKLIKNE